MQPIQKILKEHYRLRVSRAEVIHTSEDNEAYKVSAETGVFFARLGKRKEKGMDDVKSEAQFLRCLKRAGCPVPEILPDEGGNDAVLLEDGKILTLFSWIDGAPLHVSPDNLPTETQSYNAGRALAQLHNASARCVIEGAPLRRSVTTEMERAIALREKIVTKYENGQRFLAQLSDMIRFARTYDAQENIYIHNDFRPHNVLFGTGNESDRLRAVVDFDWMCSAPPVKDVALALVEWSFPDGDSGMHAELFRSFWKGYVEARDPSHIPSEQDLKQWIQFACFSDAATYVSDTLLSKTDGAFIEKHPKEIRSFMLRKAQYFETINIHELL